MSPLRRRAPPTVSALGLVLGLALGLAAPSASADMFCGEPSTKNSDPSDLSSGISDQSLEYMAQQPASMLVCSKGYLFEKCGDHDTANKIFDKCIAAGYAGAMIWKARMLEEGNGGGPPDFAKSAELLRRAAVSGDPAYGPIAKMHYATSLQLGRGVDKDEAEARRWFEQAAAEGSAEAREFLQTGYHTGSRDYSTLGAGTPTAAALAKSLPADAGGAADSGADNAARAAAHGGAGSALQARKLVSDASPATTPARLIAPPPTSQSAPQPALETATASADIEGQKLERRDPLAPAATVPPATATAALGLLLAAFFAGMLRNKRIGPRNARPGAPPISMENPA